MDERRAILAVVLIFLLLFGFNYWQSQQRRDAALNQPTAEQQETAVRDQGARELTAENQPGGDSVPAEAPEEQATDDSEAVPAVGRQEDTATAETRETTIEVRTPLWTAMLSSRGASIQSWELADYNKRLEEGTPREPVQLVTPGRRGLEVAIDYGPTTIDTGEWVFEYDGPERIVLDEARPSATVRMVARSQGGLTVERRYVFRASSYAFQTEVSVLGLTDPAARRELWVGWPGVAPTEKREDTKAAASVARIDGGIVKDGLGRFKEDNEYAHVGSVDWVTSQSRYFMAAIAPLDAAFDETRSIGDREARTVGFTAAVPIEGESFSVLFDVFAGPQDYRAISAMGVGLERAIDMGWSFTRPLSVLLLRALVWAYKYIPNYGVVIILFSILTKLLFYRLTHKSFTEMKRMQDVQPKLNALKEKYGDDKEALAKAQMELYKKEGVNPLGSCLPMILQMPVFIALFQVLRTTIELRGAPFMLWITDLSQPDTIASIAGFPIHVLPLLMGVGMLLQQRFTTAEPSQAGITKMMPILFTVLFYNFASGLVIYWLVNTILSIGQQYYIHQGPSAAAEVSSDEAAPGGVHKKAPVSETPATAFEDQEADRAGTNGAKKGSSGGTKSARAKRRKRKKK